MERLWNCDEPILSLLDEHGVELFDVPAWIEQDITPCDVASIVKGGCDSGAYMPAVTYHMASTTMAEHGDDVLEFIQREHGELPQPSSDQGWSGIAVLYLSFAVELWANGIGDALEQYLEEREAA